LEEQGCWLKTAVEGQTLTIRAGGEWTVERAGQLDALVGGLPMGSVQAVRFDVSSLTALDTAGAWIMRRTLALFEDKGIASEIAGLDPAYKPLLDIVDEADKQPHEPLREEPHFILAMFERVGRTHLRCVERIEIVGQFLRVDHFDACERHSQTETVAACRAHQPDRTNRAKRGSHCLSA